MPLFPEIDCQEKLWSRVFVIERSSQSFHCFDGKIVYQFMHLVIGFDMKAFRVFVDVEKAISEFELVTVNASPLSHSSSSKESSIVTSPPESNGLDRKQESLSIDVGIVWAIDSVVVPLIDVEVVTSIDVEVVMSVDVKVLPSVDVEVVPSVDVEVLPSVDVEVLPSVDVEVASSVPASSTQLSSPETCCSSLFAIMSSSSCIGIIYSSSNDAKNLSHLSFFSFSRVVSTSSRNL
ncbi:hypothetical protein YC2023_078436 [Brassica napus]